MAIKERSLDTRRFWLGATLAICGVAMLFVAMFIEPRGEVSGSVLGAAGEVFVLAGCLLGADSYVNYKLKKILNESNETK